jgi:hypothetical protein
MLADVWSIDAGDAIHSDEANSSSPSSRSNSNQNTLTQLIARVTYGGANEDQFQTHG